MLGKFRKRAGKLSARLFRREVGVPKVVCLIVTANELVERPDIPLSE
jgi:hypothetical protein